MNEHPQSSAAATAFPASEKGSFLCEATLRFLSEMKRGHLRLELPGGGTRDFGADAEAQRESLPVGLPSTAHLRVHRDAFFRKCLLSADIGFAESYIDGDWDSPSLPGVIAWFILNVDDSPGLSGSRNRRTLALSFMRTLNRMGHLLRPNSRAMAKRNISRHYDLSNDFFALMLDPSMMYSAAKWTAPSQTLEQAQEEKNDALCRKLRLTASDHVLEIGTGWGGWSLHAATKYGCRVTTVTLSARQHEFASRRIAAAGLAGRVDVRLCDYREIEGQYDKIVSIEMMEAVGHRYLPAFCAQLHRLLKTDGLLAFQFITCPDSRYEQFRTSVDFIQKHIFPGSLLLSLNRINDLLARTGGFSLMAMDEFGHDYARTLQLWHENFRQRLDQVRALGFDERFIRKWTYYLGYCEAAFTMRNITVVQTLHSRPNNLSI